MVLTDPYLPTRGVIAGIVGWMEIRQSACLCQSHLSRRHSIALSGGTHSSALAWSVYTGRHRPTNLFHPCTTHRRMARIYRTSMGRQPRTRYQNGSWIFMLGMPNAMVLLGLGGSFGERGTTPFQMNGEPLRGFDPASVSGDGYYLGAVEYRLPLWWID